MTGTTAAARRDPSRWSEPGRPLEPSRCADLSKAQHAYRAIKARITDGSYPPGSRLVLGAIAGELAVSVVPVREAIRLLEAEGLVDFERNIGARVASIDDAAYRDTMQTLAIVEGAATALAAPYSVPDAVRRAGEINATMYRSLANVAPTSFTQLNHDFHQTLYRQCPNSHLVEVVDQRWSRLAAIRNSTFHYIPDRAAASVREHQQLLALIDAGAEPARIERAARTHRLATLQAFLTRPTSQCTGVAI